MRKIKAVKMMAAVVLMGVAVFAAGCGGGGSNAGGSMKLRLEAPRVALGTAGSGSETISATIDVLSYNASGTSTAVVETTNLPNIFSMSWDESTYSSSSGTETMPSNPSFFIANIPPASNYIVRSAITYSVTYTPSAVRTAAQTATGTQTYTGTSYYGALVDSVTAGNTSNVTINATSTVIALATLRYAITKSAALGDTSVITDTVKSKIAAVATADSEGVSYCMYGASVDNNYSDPFVVSGWSADCVTALDAIITAANIPSGTSTGGGSTGGGGSTTPTVPDVSGTYIGVNAGADQLGTTNQEFYAMKDQMVCNTQTATCQHTELANSGTTDTTTSTTGYTIDANRILSFTEYPNIHGYVSEDGSMIFITKTSPGSEGELFSELYVKKGSGMSAASLSGEYIIHKMGVKISEQDMMCSQLDSASCSANSGCGWTGSQCRATSNISEPETSRMNITFDGAGNLTYSYTARSSASSLNSGSDTYTVSSDGTVTTTNSALSGVLSANGNVFVLVDTSPNDGFIGIAVGVKKPTAPIGMSGSFYVTSMIVDYTGSTVPFSVDSDFGYTTPTSETTGTYQGLFCSYSQECTTPDPYTMTPGTDGTFSDVEHGSVGVMSPDGKFFIMTVAQSGWTSTVNGEIELSYGIR